MKSGNGRLDNIQREVDKEIIEEKQLQNAEHDMMRMNRMMRRTTGRIRKTRRENGRNRNQM